MTDRRYNTFVQRLGALLIDGIIFGGFYLLIESITGENTLWDISSDMLWVSYSIYFHGKYGQTLGKMAFRIKVVAYPDENRLLGFQGAAKRELYSICFFSIDLLLKLLADEELYFWLSTSLFLGWLLSEIIVLWSNKYRRAIHDLIAGSVVIDVAVPTEWERKYYYGEETKKADS
jgi:uncharacterized RDD family membrane protein YckC